MEPYLYGGRRRLGWRWLGERVRRERVLLLAGALFAAILALRVIDDRPADGLLILCVVPIVLCAIDRGPAGGVWASVVSVGLTPAWSAIEGAEVSLLGYIARAVAYLTVGVLVGRFAVERRALESKLARRYDVAVELQCAIGFDGYFKDMNPVGCTFFGYSREELLARQFEEFVHPQDREKTLREAERLLADGTTTASFENRYRTHDGSYRWLAWTAHSVAADNVIYCVARDITTQRSHRDLLEELVLERTSELERARMESLQRLALAAEYRDDETHRHTERVGALAALLAEQMDLPRQRIEQLRQAAPLHDVGKLGIPDAILLKPGRLTGGERSVMQTHTTIGAAILSDSGFPVLSLAEQIALSHHERWDGTGYPHRLKGEAIPLVGRIVAVVDVFDALTHARPYKRAWTLEDAVTEIARGSGTQFDPNVVTAFEHLHQQGELKAMIVAHVPRFAPGKAEIAT
jgi:PAS domain S-box-containing protein